MGRGLGLLLATLVRGDPVVRTTLGAGTALLALYFLPILSAESRSALGYAYAPMALLGLSLVAVFYRFRRIESLDERRFWLWTGVAQGFWLLSWLLYLPSLEWTPTLGLADKLLQIATYCALFLAIALGPHVDTRSRFGGHTYRIEALATSIFLAAIVVYAFILPGVLIDEPRESYLVPLALFTVLDFVLLVCYAHARRLASSTRWKFLYGALAVYAGMWAALDLTEVLMHLDVLPLVSAGTPIDFFWFSPCFLFVGVARARDSEAWRETGESSHLQVEKSHGRPVWMGPMVFYACAFPALHFGLYLAGFLDPAVRRERELCVLVLLVSLLILAVARKRALDREIERRESLARQSERMEALGRVAGGVAHDFNNLLTAISGYARLALDSVRGDDKLRADLTEVVKAGDRAAVLTEQLLTFGRAQRDEPQILSLNPLVENTMNMLERLLGEAIELSFEPARELWPIRAERAQVEQVLLNLVLNARDAIGAGGRGGVMIETRNVAPDPAFASTSIAAGTGSYVELSVTDTGSGMDDVTIERIFDPFFTTKPGSRGTGLGLSIVHRIVTQHGGGVDVTSRSGVGTTFRVYWPKANVSLDASEPTPEPRTTPGTGSILVVDDDALVREVATEILRRSGYDVIAAEGPQDAETLFASSMGRVSLVLTDVVMPGASGFTLYRRLSSRSPRLKVLFMSGYSDGVIAREGGDALAPLVRKPFSPAVLTRKVRELLDA